MNWQLKIALALVAGASLFGFGWFSRGERITTVTAPPVIVTQTETKVDTKIVKQIVHEKVTEPTGKVTETTTETVTQDKHHVTDTSKAVPTLTPVGPKTKWALGVNWQPRIELDAYKPTGVEISHRIYETNAWGSAGYDWHSHAVTVGLRIEF